MRRTSSPLVLACAFLALGAGCVQNDVPAQGDSRAALSDFTLAPAGFIPNAAGTHAAEPHVAVRAVPGGPPVVVVGAIEYMPGSQATQDVRFSIAIHRSMDGGATWTSALLPPEVTRPFDPAAQMNYLGDPVLAYGPGGELYLGGVAAQGVWKEGPGFPLILQLNDLSVFLTRSDDDGKTWSPAVFWQRGAGSFGFPVLFAGLLQDKEWVTVGPDGVVHFTWTEFVQTFSRLHYVRSTDGGATWSTPVTLASSMRDPRTDGDATRDQRLFQATTIAAPGGERVYVSATEYAPAPGAPAPTQGGKQLVWASSDNGATFAPPATVGPSTFARFGTVFADPRDPARAMVVSAQDKEESRVYLTQTRDGGSTWTQPLWLAPERSGAQQQPTGWIDAAGRAHVGFYDAGWPDGERFVLSLVDDDRVVFQDAPEGEPVDPGFARRDYVGMAGFDHTAWAVWVGGSEESGTSIEFTTLTAST